MLRVSPFNFFPASGFNNQSYTPVDLNRFLGSGGDLFQSGGQAPQDYLQMMQMQLLGALLMQLDPMMLIQMIMANMLSNAMNGGAGANRGMMGNCGFGNQRRMGNGDWSQRNSGGVNGGINDMPAANGPGPANLNASIDRVRNQGSTRQMIEGRITVNGNTYQYRSGGSGRGSLPPGSYNVTSHMMNRGDRGMNVGGVGYSFAMSDKYDPRVGGTRSALRIHPDGGGPGTAGCVGIVGNAATQAQFRADMAAELRRNGGRLTLNVG